PPRRANPPRPRYSARPPAHAHLRRLAPGSAPQGCAAEAHRRHRAQRPAAGAVVPRRDPPPRPRMEVWKDVKLPDGKIIIPGVIDSTSNFVEHPELVADRIVQYARVAGTENVIAGGRLRLRRLRRPAAGRLQDRGDEGAPAPRA